jgi:hypothetical protein
MYRLKRVVSYMSDGTNKVKYFPQRKVFRHYHLLSFWRNFRQTIDLSATFESVSFETEEEAIAFLKEIKKKVKQNIEVNV